MEGASLPGPEMQDCNLKNIFPNKFNTFPDFISDMGVIDHRHYSR